MHLRSSLLIAATALTLAVPAAHGQDAFPGFGRIYGGGVFVGDSRTASEGTTAIGLRRVSPAGNQLVIRLTVVLPCKPPASGGLRGSELTVTARVRPDGTFTMNNRPARTTGEVGRVRVTMQGKLAAERADGTAKVSSTLRCGGQVRTWSARSIDYIAGGGGSPAPADGMLYGVTSESREHGPHGFIALVSGGATQIQAFTSYTEKCEGRDRKGLYTAKAYIQDAWKAEPFANGVVKRHEVVHETAAGRKRGIRNTLVTNLDATFSQANLNGTISDSSDWHHGRLFDRCQTVPITFSARP